MNQSTGAIAGRLAAAALALTCAAAHAQETYPARPVKVILPLEAGSASDVAVRVIGERLSENLKQSFLVENALGASGLVGTERAAAARPDGYTLAALNNSILTILPNIRRDQVKFDSLNDFIPIRGIAVIPTMVGVSKDLPVASVRELIEYAKARPGELNYSSGGAGSPQHLATEMFQSMAGIKLTHVPYKGATQATAGLAAGQVQVMMIAHSLALPHLPAGRLKLIAFAGSQRSAALPELPTVSEAGVPGFAYESWIALFAPKGTSEDVVRRLREESARVLAQPAIKERLAKSGLEIWDRGPQQLRDAIRDELARWKQVVAAANIKAD